ncbi:MAG: Gfo/Idh/MocA family oxidoreductase [Anaerolineales bacterium]|jgi:predicted dehydrogenase
MDDIRFAVIGAGFMGRLLARTASSLPYARCVGATDLDLPRAEALTTACGGRPFVDSAEMLEQVRPHVVFVATPEPDHCRPAILAAEHGCHLFIEKPLATSLEDADEITDACARAGVRLMVGYILRFEPCYAQIQSALDQGMIGRFLSAYARRDVAIHEARRLAGRISPILYLAVHDIDQIMWYHPSAVRSVHAHGLGGRVQEEFGVDDYAWITMDFADGAVANVECGWAYPEAWANWSWPSGWGSFGDVQMHIVGTDGVLNLDMTPMGVTGCDPEGWKFPESRHWPEMHGRPSGAVHLEVEHFFDCVIGGRQPLVTGGDGRRSLEVALAAERSITEGGPVALPL